MPTISLRRLAIVVSVAMTLLALVACLSLKVVTDIMASHAEELAETAHRTHDPGTLAELQHGIEGWSRTADYIGLGVGALVLAGTGAIIWGMYRTVFLPIFGLSEATKRFTEGDREARAKPSAGVELAAAAKSFNEMADLIVGQHERMLEFLGGAAQELKDPVNVMRMALAEFAPDRPLPPEQLTRNRLALLSREIDRLQRMVERYLDASNIEWKRLDLQQGRQDLRAIAQHVVSLYERFSTEHQVVLSVPEQPVCVFSDPDRLGQVIHTLIINGIEFSPRGGVVEIAVTTEHTGHDEALLRVTDHGIGFSEQDLAKLFEPFERLRAAHQKGPGASVALSVAKRIVEAHRGRLDVTSKVGEGSTFCVRLPLAASLPSGRRANGAPEPQPEATH
jgi:signal transduction histidine kinase